MTTEEAQAHIDETHIIQSKLRDELVALLVAWSDGPPPPTAGYLWQRLLDLQIDIDEFRRAIRAATP